MNSRQISTAIALNPRRSRRRRQTHPRRRAGQIQFEQFRQRVLFGNVGGPAIGGGDRRIEIALRVGEPLRTCVVEVGERALLEFGRRRLRVS
jgi:hypothetical protein